MTSFAKPTDRCRSLKIEHGSHRRGRSGGGGGGGGGGRGNVTSVTCDIFWGFLMDNAEQTGMGRGGGGWIYVRRREATDPIDIEMKCEVFDRDSDRVGDPCDV